MTLADIRLLLVDVDGVLTAGGILLGPGGGEFKEFNSLDGHGVRLLREAGVEVGVLTARRSEALAARAAELGIKALVMECPRKEEAAERLRRERGLEWFQVAAIGDDLPDLPLLSRAGFAAAPANAAGEVRRRAHYVCRRTGGAGALREVADKILRVRRLLGRRA